MKPEESESRLSSPSLANPLISDGPMMRRSCRSRSARALVLRARHLVAHDVAVRKFLDLAVARRDVGVDEGGCGDRRRGGERQHERESGSHGFHAEARQSCQHIFDTSRVTPAWFNDTDAGVFLTMSGIIRRSRTAAT